MLIPRQHHQASGSKISVKKFNESGLEVKPIYKKMPQHSHINKLLSTAAAGNRVIGDVDALLAPLHDTRSMDQHQSAASKERTERNLWRNEEVMEMLFVMNQLKALEKLNDKTVKSENVFKEVETVMRRNGFVKKSHVQIWTKWKFLKSTYMTSRRNGIIPRMIPLEVYETLHQMITSHNQSISECGNSMTGSMDDDNSNTGMERSKNSSAANGDEDDSFGMAHPIFGFRLGLVKNEPADTGYEATESNETALNTELADESHEMLPNNPKQSTPKDIPIKKTLEIPHRGRGRPPKYPPAASSTPNNTLSPSSGQSNAQMPPLRVAPFAKAANITNALAANRAPPPLTQPPTPRPISVTSISNISEVVKNSDALKNVQRKILPKPSLNQMQPIRIPKEITVQSSRASSTPSPSYPKLKQVPMRKTPYSLRPDRVIPDLDESFSPPPPDAPEKSKRFEDVPSTSHLIMQSNENLFQNGINRKRRLDWPQTTAVPTKLKRIQTDDEEAPEVEQGKSRKADVNYGKLLQSVIVDLSTTLRKVQTQMMNDFFNRQHELLQKEHEFQMQQDRLIMETFQLQTHAIMSSVKELVGTIAPSGNNSDNERRHVETKIVKQAHKFHNGRKQTLRVNGQREQQTYENGIHDHNDSGQQSIQHNAEEIYSDEELHELPEHNGDRENKSQTNGEAVEEDEDDDTQTDHFHNQGSDNQSISQQNRQQLEAEQQINGDDEVDDGDDTESEDDEDDTDSDTDDESAEMVNDNDQGTLQMVSTELMEEEE